MCELKHDKVCLLYCLKSVELPIEMSCTDL